MEQVREFIERITQISDADWRIFSSKLVELNVPKKSLLLDIGQTENYLSFIKSGAIRIYTHTPKNDLTFGFAFENEFITGFDSLISRAPSEYKIETLQNTTLWHMTYTDLQSIYSTTKAGERIGRKMAEIMYLKKSARELSLLNKTAEQRYVELFSTRPELFQNIPMKYIASYIGVTPQALSRIRKRIS